MTSGATIEGDYRYNLWREFKESPDEPTKTVVFVMLNPSTADAETNDATIRRCIGFSKLWGFNKLVVVNLFAYRSTDPKALRKVKDPIGPKNDRFIEEAAIDCDMVIAAWGNNAVWSGRHSMRNKEVIDLISKHKDIYCLGTTMQHQPKHPVRLAKELEPVGFWEKGGSRWRDEAGTPGEIDPSDDVTKPL